VGCKARGPCSPPPPWPSILVLPWLLVTDRSNLLSRQALGTSFRRPDELAAVSRVPPAAALGDVADGIDRSCVILRCPEHNQWQSVLQLARALRYSSWDKTKAKRESHPARRWNPSTHSTGKGLQRCRNSECSHLHSCIHIRSHRRTRQGHPELHGPSSSSLFFSLLTEARKHSFYPISLLPPWEGKHTSLVPTCMSCTAATDSAGSSRRPLRGKVRFALDTLHLLHPLHQPLGLGVIAHVFHQQVQVLQRVE
jgi:hypothetical protein